MRNEISLRIENPKIGTRVCQPEITVRTEAAMILSGSYPEMRNLPQIEGITLRGNRSAEGLSLLSAKAERYGVAALSDVRDTHCVIALGEENVRVPLSALAGVRIQTAASVPADMKSGDYLFLTKE